MNTSLPPSGGLPLPQHSPRVRRSSVPARPVPSPKLSPRPSQIDLRTSQRVLASVPPSPLDVVPRQVAPSRPNTQYDVLPPPVAATPANSQSRSKKNLTYDTLPKPLTVVDGVYDRPPPVAPSRRVSNYDVLPSPPPAAQAPPMPRPVYPHTAPSSPAPALPSNPAVPSSPAPAVPSNPAVPSSSAPALPPTSVGLTDYDVLPSPSPTSPAKRKISASAMKNTKNRNHGYDSLPPMTPETPTPAPTFAPAGAKIAGKRRPPMLVQKSVPNTQAPKTPPSGYINLDTANPLSKSPG